MPSCPTRTAPLGCPPPTFPWPLTGVETTDPVKRPALAVKIENSPESRPQSGLNAADMVWEEVVEGGITRFSYRLREASADGPVESLNSLALADDGDLQLSVYFDDAADEPEAWRIVESVALRPQA